MHEDERERGDARPDKGALQALRELAPEERDAHLRLFLKLFGGTYGAFKVLAVLRVWLGVRRRGILRTAQGSVRAVFQRDRAALKTALFTSLYPVLYKLQRRLSRLSSSPSSHSPLVSAATVAPLALLLPDNILTQLNLYAASALALVLARLAGRQGYLDALPRALKTGDGWWLFPLTQGFLLPLCIFEGRAFPGAYRSVIVGRSSRYLPQNIFAPSRNALLSLYALFSSNPFPYPSLPLPLAALEQYFPFIPLLDAAHPHHTRAMCAVMHPDTVGCTTNFAKSVGDTLPMSAALVGGYSGAVMLASRRHRSSPAAAVRRWLEGTARGAGFMTLAISTAWYMMCVWQRVLPAHVLAKTRFSLSGIVAGLWILLVPSARRLELGMYSLRLSMLSAYRLGVIRRWWTRRRGVDVLPFAVSMAVLLQLHRKDPTLVEGWVGRVLGWLNRPVFSEVSPGEPEEGQTLRIKAEDAEGYEL